MNTNTIITNKKMKQKLSILMLLCALCACSSSEDSTGDNPKDMTDPVISGEGITANPIDCQVYRRGELIPFNYVFTDNVELGAFNIEIHDNFDHHTHGTTSVDCELEPDKSPVAPWRYNRDFEIPQGSKSYTARIDIPIPADVDAGDYHFMVRLTDRSGRQTLHAVAIKLQ